MKLAELPLPEYDAPLHSQEASSAVLVPPEQAHTPSVGL
jgi:hypothetical protein